MIDQDYIPFTKIWKNICNVYNKVPAPEVISIAFRSLAQYPLDVIIQACDMYVRTKKFSPVPADIVAIIDGTDKLSEVEFQNALAIRALDQWRVILDASSRYGMDNQFVLDDHNARYALEVIGGIKAVCLSDHNTIPFIRKDFINAYKAYAINSCRETREVFNENGSQNLIRIASDGFVNVERIKALPKIDAVRDENNGVKKGISISDRFADKNPMEILQDIISNL